MKHTSNYATLKIKKLQLANVQASLGLSLQLVEFINMFLPTAIQSEPLHVDMWQQFTSVHVDAEILKASEQREEL